MNETTWDKLCSYLSSLPPGPVDDTSQIVAPLSEHWDELDGGDQEGMAGWKLWGRMEEVQWVPPDLVFLIERHGGTVQGATRADLQRWAVDVQAKRATCDSRYGHRQVKPMAKRVYAKELAKELVDVIEARKDDDRLTWSKGHRHVRVNLRKSVGATDRTPKQTVAGHSRRLRDELIRVLPEQGWGRAGLGGAEFEFKG